MDLKILLLGFGDAGKAFCKLLKEKEKELEKSYGKVVKVVGISTRSRGALYNADGIDVLSAIEDVETKRKFDSDHGDYVSMDSISMARDCDYDVLVEATVLNIETGEPASTHISTALERGKHVVSANKGPLAWHYEELKNLAEKNRCKFFYETCVMDGTPIFNFMEKTLPLCKVLEVKGIYNSTTNYILEEMERGIPYETILEKGKERGFIEANPAMDIEGYDAAAKLTSLLNVLMDANITPVEIQRKGIEDITMKDIQEAAAEGKVIKLLCKGIREDGKVKGYVYPAAVPRDSLEGSIHGTTSLFTVTTDLMGTLSVVEHEPEIEQTAYGMFQDIYRVLQETE